MDTDERGRPLDGNTAARMLYEARLQVFETASTLVMHGAEPDKVLAMVDAVEARLLAPDIDRTWVIHFVDDQHWYFAGFAAGLPTWCDTPKGSVRFARRQDAAEVLETMPLQDEEDRVRMQPMVATGAFT